MIVLAPCLGQVSPDADYYTRVILFSPGFYFKMHRGVAMLHGDRANLPTGRYVTALTWKNG
jgi:hypothetical protein